MARGRKCLPVRESALPTAPRARRAPGLHEAYEPATFMRSISTDPSVLLPMV